MNRGLKNLEAKDKFRKSYADSMNRKPADAKVKKVNKVDIQDIRIEPTGLRKEAINLEKGIDKILVGFIYPKDEFGDTERIPKFLSGDDKLEEVWTLDNTAYNLELTRESKVDPKSYKKLLRRE